jgi:hypothetical protein
VQHAYGLLVAVLGWVLFRSATMEQAGSYFRTMFGAGGVPAWDPLADLTWARGWVLMLIAAVLSAGVADRLVQRLRRQTMPVADADLRSAFHGELDPPERITAGSAILMIVVAAACLAVATIFLVSVSYSPFIYFRF